MLPITDHIFFLLVPLVLLVLVPHSASRWCVTTSRERETVIVKSLNTSFLFFSFLLTEGGLVISGKIGRFLGCADLGTDGSVRDHLHWVWSYTTIIENKNNSLYRCSVTGRKISYKNDFRHRWGVDFIFGTSACTSTSTVSLEFLQVCPFFTALSYTKV